MSARHTFAISDSVRTVLSQSDIGSTYVALPPTQLDRKLYVDVNAVLVAAGGKWNRFDRRHDGPPGWTDKLKDMLGSGVVVREKVVLQAFYTPKAVAERAVELLGIGAVPERVLGVVGFNPELVPYRPTVLEPSCGDGALVRAILKRRPNAVIQAYEIDPTTCEKARVLERLAAHEGTVRVECANFLRVAIPDQDLWRYNHIIMNPPYQRGQFKKHFEHALCFLREKYQHASLVAIAPSNFTPDEQKVKGYRVTEIPIPAGAFKESGTLIATKYVVLTRRT